MFDRRLAPLLWSVALMGSACDTPKPEPGGGAPAAVDASGPLPVVRFAPGTGALVQNSGYTAPTTVAIRDSAAWVAAWTTLHANQQPIPALPVIDFSKEMVVVVALGTRSNGGFSVAVARASEQAGKVTVVATETAPGPTCAVPEVITAPADVAKLPRREGDVTFTMQREVHAC